jgi:hypothetical protein
MKKIFATLCVILLFAASCKKSDSSSDKRSILTTGKWRIASSSAIVEYPSPIGTQTVDVLAALPNCQRDNGYIFNGDGTITADEGATKCNSTDPQQKPAGNWTLLSNDTQLRVYGNGADVTADIIAIDNSMFSIRYVTTSNGIRSTTTTTYVLQ